MSSSPSTAATRREVIVVGAGTSGLSLAFHLKRRGLEPVVLDADDAPGSAWRKRHDQLRLNTHRWLSALPGKPLPRKLGAFVSRQDYIAYLDGYAQWLAQTKGVEIRYGTAVSGIEREHQAWRLRTSRGDLRSSRVILATGPEQVPFIPFWEGRDTCAITQRHAADFGQAKQYRGKRVLIVGGANSGIDIANTLVRNGNCDSLAIAMREGTHLLPTRLLGLPTQLTAPLLTALPLRVQDRVGAIMSRLCFGDLRPWGIRTPRTGICSRLALEGVAPGFDDGFVAGVKAGQVKVFPQVRRFREHAVEFVDGSTLVCDAVIFATGYRNGLPGLIGHLGVVDGNGRSGSDGTGRDNPLPGLWVFGMQPRLEGNIHARVKEARQLAAIVARQTS